MWNLKKIKKGAIPTQEGLSTQFGKWKHEIGRLDEIHFLLTNGYNVRYQKTTKIHLGMLQSPEFIPNRLNLKVTIDETVFFFGGGGVIVCLVSFYFERCVCLCICNALLKQFHFLGCLDFFLSLPPKNVSKHIIFYFGVSLKVAYHDSFWEYYYFVYIW